MMRRLERLGLTGHADQWTERYVLCEKLVDPAVAEPRQEFEATSRFIRDLVAHRWAKTRREREHAEPKRIHYLSMEFLLGRTLRNNMMNLAAEPLVRHAMQQQGWNLQNVFEEEPDAGLGNGGLGRLAACFIDSLATLEYPAIGYGLRYEYGIFRQVIRDGSQVEQPAAQSRSLGDRPAPKDVCRAAELDLRAARLHVDLHAQQAFQPPRSGLRSAGGGVRRQMYQHAAAVVRRRAAIIRFCRILAW
jgi:starch phosphorylase